MRVQQPSDPDPLNEQASAAEARTTEQSESSESAERQVGPAVRGDEDADDVIVGVDAKEGQLLEIEPIGDTFDTASDGNGGRHSGGTGYGGRSGGGSEPGGVPHGWGANDEDIEPELLYAGVDGLIEDGNLEVLRAANAEKYGYSLEEMFGVRNR